MSSKCPTSGSGGRPLACTPSPGVPLRTSGVFQQSPLLSLGMFLLRKTRVSSSAGTRASTHAPRAASASSGSSWVLRHLARSVLVPTQISAPGETAFPAWQHALATVELELYLRGGGKTPSLVRQGWLGTGGGGGVTRGRRAEVLGRGATVLTN